MSEDAQSFAKQFATDGPFSGPKKTLRMCPKCGIVSSQSIEVTLKEINGNYCIHCYAQWIDANIPKLGPLNP